MKRRNTTRLLRPKNNPNKGLPKILILFLQQERLGRLFFSNYFGKEFIYYGYTLYIIIYYIIRYWIDWKQSSMRNICEFPTKILVDQHNAPAHSSAAMFSKLMELGLQPVLHPLYYPDLAFSER